MEWTSIFFGFLFVAAGIVFICGKAQFFIPAWRNMSAEDKSKVRIIPLCRNIGIMISLCGVLFLLRGFCPAIGKTAFTLALVAWLVACVVDLRYIDKSCRYKTE